VVAFLFDKAEKYQYNGDNKKCLRASGESIEIMIEKGMTELWMAGRITQN